MHARQSLAVSSRKKTWNESTLQKVLQNGDQKNDGGITSDLEMSSKVSRVVEMRKKLFSKLLFERF